MPCVKWKSDLGKVVITSNFEHRGWQQAADGDDWRIWWASVSTIQHIFGPNSSLAKLQDGQRINHFPNQFELTHKDLLVKNINRYRSRLRKARAEDVPQLIPTTFVLPQDYALFVEEFKKQPSSSTFILKPASKAQGKGIFLINKLSQVAKQFSTPTKPDKRAVPPVFLPSGNPSSRAAAVPAGSTAPAAAARMQDYVVSRYIDNPLLLGGAKFDLRLYVLVPSFQPLVVYLSSLGFARFSSVRFSREVAELDNQLVHLTNVAVQKEGSSYNSSHGHKWPLQDLRLHLEATRGHGPTAQLFEGIESLVLHTLKAVQPVIINDKHCFELYGFDVLIDDALQPWLIEVNASPSMTSTTAADRLLKWQVVNDSISIITPQTHAAQAGSSCPAAAAGAHSRRHKSAAGTKAHSQKAATMQQQLQQQVYPAAVGCMQLLHHGGLEAPINIKRRRKTSKLPAADAAGAAAGSPAGAKGKRVVLHG